MVGKKIRKIRKNADLTLDEMEKLTGISKTYLSDLETGKAENPSIKILRKIASSLEIDVAELLQDTGEEKERTGIVFNHPGAFDDLEVKEDFSEKKYKKVLALVEETLRDPEISVERREELADSIISLLEWVLKLQKE